MHIHLIVITPGRPVLKSLGIMGDEELVEEYGEYEEIKDLSDEKLLDIFAFMHSFRG